MNARSEGESAPAPEVSYVVPTVGVPGHLAGCLGSIYRDAAGTGLRAELVVVWQHPSATARTAKRGTGGLAGGPAALRELARRLASERPAGLASRTRIVQLPRPAGFARAANAGIAASAGRWIALVNDDAELAEGWTRTLLEALDAFPDRIAAAQGINLLPAGDDGEVRIDGAGLGWNRRWQAVQVGRGKPAPAPGGEPAPVYGVSATAAIYRRDALAAVSPAGGQLRPFDERLDSYYEDVELADRLRRGSYRAVLAPAARVEHAGALSSRGRRAARRRVRRIYCNRLLVLASRLGRRFWGKLPGFLLRDAVDLLRGRQAERLPGDPRPPGPVDLLFAWCRAARRLPRFAGWGAAQPSWTPEADGASGTVERGRRARPVRPPDQSCNDASAVGESAAPPAPRPGRGGVDGDDR